MMSKKIFSFIILFLVLFSVASCKEDNSYIVTFNSNGGTLVDAIEVNAKEGFIPLFVPIKDGYLFDGWYLDQNFNYLMAFNAGVTKNTTLYAKWVLEVESLTEAEIRSIIDDILLDQDLVIADELTISNLVHSLLESGEIIDADLVINAFLENIDVVKIFEDHVTNMLKEVKQSVVAIDAFIGSNIDGSGSGVIYKKDGNKYYVLTNEHVTYGYNSNQFQITIFTENGEVIIPKGSITLKGESLLHDMAVLEFTSAIDLKVIEFGERDDLRVGQMVFSIGSPLDLPNSVTTGIISYLDREMSDEYGMNTITIQHTAAINPGNSGGALVNIYGKLVGLNNMSYVDEYLGEGIEGLHFAIQIDIIKQLISSLE
jgi:uncharacterized repeat protein (TIGR02543 family)